MGLPHHIHAVRQVKLDKEGFVVGACAQVGASEQGPVRGIAHQVAVRGTSVGPLVPSGRNGQVGAGRTTCQVDVAGAAELHAVAAVALRAAAIGGQFQGGERCIEAEEQPVQVAATEHGLRSARRYRCVEALGARGHHRSAARIQRDLSTEVVAVVVHELRALVQSIVAGAPHEGAAEQVGAIGGQVRHGHIRSEVEAVALATGQVHEAAHQRDLCASVERGVVAARRGREVGRARDGQHEQLVRTVHHQAVRRFIVRTAEVGAPFQVGPVRQPLAHPDVDATAGEARLQRAQRGGIAQPEHDARAVERAIIVVGGREAEVVRGAAAEAAEGELGVDGDAIAGLKTEGAGPDAGTAAEVEPKRVAFKGVCGCDLDGRTTALNEGHRGFLHHLTCAKAHMQIAVLQRELILAFVAKTDDVRIMARGHDQVVLQSCATVEAKVHAGINATHEHLPEDGTSGSPMRRVVPDEVVLMVGERVDPCRCSGGRSIEVHPVSVHMLRMRCSIIGMAMVRVQAPFAEHIGERALLHEQHPAGDLRAVKHLGRPLAAVLREGDHGPRPQRDVHRKEQGEQGGAAHGWELGQVKTVERPLALPWQRGRRTGP